MSAFYSFAYADRVHVLTDAGFFDEQMNLVAIDKKIFTSPNFPFAIAARGADWAEVWATISDLEEYIDELAWYDDVDAFLPIVAQYFQELGERKGRFDADFLIAAFSKEKGAVHFFIQCHGNYEVPSFELVTPGWQISAGPPIDINDLGHLHLTADDLAECDFPVKYGAEIMTAMRRKKGRIPGRETDFFAVGGRCDLTTVTASGAVTTTLLGWDDVLGMPISPDILATLS